MKHDAATFARYGLPAILRRTSCLVAAAVVCLPNSARASPSGGIVSAGQATIAQSGINTTITQSSSRAVIDWNSFNIGSGESVQFIQPGTGSVALNRIHDQNPSQILGSLTANGQVWLVNPNGIFFGQSAKVDVAGLVATTANINDRNFMRGNFTFDAPGNTNASVVNEGQITVAQAGLAALVAPNVANSGVITAKLGKVELASGDTFALDTYGDGLLSLAVSPQVTQQLVQNSGLIAANGGTVKLTAAAGTQVVNSLVNNTGIIEAESAGYGRNGEIILYAEGSNAVAGNDPSQKGRKAGASMVANSGVLDASGYGSGQTGGSISVLADNVGILSGSIIDASGDAGGGTIKIGGDFHGAGTTPTALNTYVDANTLILANANTSGNGGNVAVWADGNTWFAGNIMAEGGVNGGNGGFVETSGHGYLDATGYVDLLALNGQKGTYLLDPSTIEIYGNVTPAFNATDSTISLSSSLQLWLDASNQSSVQLTYNSLGTTATGSSGTNTITVGSNTGMVVGERIQLGGSSDTYAASVNDNASGSGIYTITNISGTTITLDANLAGSVSGATVYGGYVSKMNDLSGNGNNATQATAANMPLWISNGQNGLGVASFNGSSDILNGTGAQGKQSIFATLTPFVTSGGAGYTGVFASESGNTGTMLLSHSGSSAWGTYPAGSSGTTLAANQGYILSLDGLDTGNLYTNSAADGTFTSTQGQAASGQYIIGGTTAQGFDGLISEVITYNSALSTSARNLVEQYQSAKWGIALTGPGNASGESGLTGAEAQAAMASTQAGAAADGYSVFADTYLERLSQTSNIKLEASGNITLDLQGDNMALASGKSISLTSTGGNIDFISPGTITTNNAAITLTPGTGGSIVLNSGSAVTLASQGGAIDLAGPVSLGSTLTINSGGGNVTFGSTVDGPGALTINNGAGTITQGGTFGGTTALGGLTVSGSGPFTLAHPVTTNSVDFSGYTGTLTMNNGLTVNGNVTLGSGMTIAGSSGLTVGASGTLDFNGVAWPNALTLGQSASQTVTLASDTTIDGDLILSSAAGNTLTINGNDLYVGGNLTLSSSVGSNHNVTVDGTTHIVLDGTGTWSQVNGASNLNNNLTIDTAGTIDISGTVEYSGILSYDAGTVNTTGPTLYTVANTTLPDGIVWDNLNLGYRNSSTVTLTSDVTATGNVTLSSDVGQTVTINGYNLYVGGNLSLNSFQSNHYTTATGTTTIVLDGTGTWSQSNPGGVLENNLTIDTPGTITVSGTVGYNTGTFTYTAGTVTTTGSTLDVASNTTLPSGIAWDNLLLGSLTDQTITLSGNTTVNGNLTLSSNDGSVLTVNNHTLYVGGDLYLYGGAGGLNYTTATGTTNIVLDGTGTWSALNNGILKNNLTIDTPGMITLGGPINYNTGTLTVSNGTLNLNGNNFTPGGTFVIGSGGTLELQGSETITTPTLDSGATVKFTGNGDGLANTYALTNYFGGNYQNLVIDSADGATDTFRLGAALSIAGSLTNTAGTLDVSASNYGIVVSGNWANTGTFNPRAGTVMLDGASPSISGTDNFYALAMISAGSVTLPAITAHSINVQATGAASDITLSGDLAASGSSNAIVLAAGRNFINDAGSGALSTPSGRYLVYSTNPASNTMGSLSDAGIHLFNKTYTGYPPASVTQSGNLWLYSLSPTLTVTADNQSRNYGQANPSLTYSVSGFVDGDTSAILSGAPSLTTAAASTSNAGSYTITASLGTLANALGYGFSTANGTLTVSGGPSAAPIPPNVERAVTIPPQVAQSTATGPLSAGPSDTSAAPGEDDADLARVAPQAGARPVPQLPENASLVIDVAEPLQLEFDLGPRI